MVARSKPEFVIRQEEDYFIESSARTLTRIIALCGITDDEQKGDMNVFFLLLFHTGGMVTISLKTSTDYKLCVNWASESMAKFLGSWADAITLGGSHKFGKRSLTHQPLTNDGAIHPLTERDTYCLVSGDGTIRSLPKRCDGSDEDGSLASSLSKTFTFSNSRC